MTACGAPLPTAEQQQTARAVLPDLLTTGVARSRRSEDSVTALRWDVEEVDLSDERWSWREIEVVAESSAGEVEAVTDVWRIALDPRALSADVPATISRQSWGLTLICADGPCIRRAGIRTIVADGQRTEEPLPPETVSRHEWLFDEYEDRDRATMLVKTALGFRPR